RTARAAELVCTNSFKSDAPEVAAGLLKEELRQLGSLVLQAADGARVPSGQDLSVDRDAFATAVEAGLAEAGVRRIAGELVAIDPAITTIVATGPLTSPDLARVLERLTGQEHLHFFDAAAPIVVGESIDRTLLFRASRYGKGGDAYLNIPLDRSQYEAFVAGLVAAEQVELREFERTMWFESCLPLEEMARRGPETLRFGPLKPLGLTDPRTGLRPYAVVQLRPDDAASDLFNLVGFQTNLRWPEQRRLFRSLPGLGGAEFARLGVMHRNTYVNSPALLLPSHRLRSAPRTYLAGQLIGVEGYLESAMSGLVAALNVAAAERGGGDVVFPEDTAIGSLVRYVTTAQREFAPMNATWGLFPSLADELRRTDKRTRARAYLARARGSFAAFVASRPDLVATPGAAAESLPAVP
ncbi:MAG: methylenetetrahydrofolate--tRNA-(uracil(54)-C(5))-methyltransferase (FADH(2)-oxidizing) TrmFO, partial [Chloroflexota bacterium]|nr:methylenetetrahydrofolate--tRNA-(uracil(54)-C(5))-methyltransferase (FADH(2)-oxidizing) TrmFO [Chloroflexota bacterium]